MCLTRAGCYPMFVTIVLKLLKLPCALVISWMDLTQESWVLQCSVYSHRLGKFPFSSCDESVNAISATQDFRQTHLNKISYSTNKLMGVLIFYTIWLLLRRSFYSDRSQRVTVHEYDWWPQWKTTDHFHANLQEDASATDLRWNVQEIKNVFEVDYF